MFLPSNYAFTLAINIIIFLVLYKLHSVNGPLALAGKFTSEISTKDAVTVGTFYVAANSKGNLLSFKSATDLKLLHVNVDTVHHASIGQH